MSIEWQSLHGLVEYESAIKMMDAHVSAMIEGKADEKILCLEHDHIYTYGSSAKAEELLDANKVPVVATGRGGKFTYHGPGQIVVYPMLNLALLHRQKDVHLYVRTLEQWIINSLACLAIDSYLIDGMVGIWTKYQGQDTKICAIGIRLRKWITYHGIALNFNTDLDKFSGIIACGIKDRSVTSISALGVKVTRLELETILRREFLQLF